MQCAFVYAKHLHPIRLGGKGNIVDTMVVEVDETKIGRYRKGLHGHPIVVYCGLWGAVE